MTRDFHEAEYSIRSQSEMAPLATVRLPIRRPLERKYRGTKDPLKTNDNSDSTKPNDPEHDGDTDDSDPIGLVIALATNASCSLC